MAAEIERKFMVLGTKWRDCVKSSHNILQGYICSNPAHVVRVRLFDDKAFLTLKSKNKGLSRLEYEIAISPSLAKELINTFCNNALIVKTRHIAFYKKQKYEIDEYNGKLKGLIIAEAELNSENEKLKKPDWLGKEISQNKKFYNSNLIKYESLADLMNEA